MFLKELSYFKNEVIRHITADIGSSSEDPNDSDEE